MTLNELLAALEQRGIKLHADAGKLRCVAPKGALDAELSAAIRVHKSALLELLAQPAAPTHAAAPAAAAATMTVIPRADRSAPLPLSHAQERLWFWDQLHGANHIYNIPIAIPLVDEILDQQALAASCRQLIQRHEILRTVFHRVDGLPVQHILPQADCPLKSLSLSRPYAAHETAARDQEVRELLRHEAQQPFDLARGPLVRCAVLRVAEQHHVVLLCLHHIISDGWSNLIIMRELTALYQAFSRGHEAPLPPLDIQYADYCQWQRRQLADHAGSLLSQQLAYWQRQLADLPPVLELPYDYPRPAVQQHQGDSLAFELDPRLSAQLQALARAQGVSLFMLLLAVFMVMLARYSGRRDIVVGSPLSNRRLPQLEEMVGPFINTMALRAPVVEEQPFTTFLHTVRRVVLEAFENQDVPFEQVVNALNVPRTLAHEPLVQVNFLLKAAPPGELRQRAGTTLDEQFGFNMRHVSGYAKSDLTVMTKEEGDRIVGWFEYSSALFAEDSVRQMIGHYQNLLHSLVTDHQVRIQDLAMLSIHDLARLRAWSGRDNALPAPASPLDLWHDCVARHGAQLALAGVEGRGDKAAARRYTYAELDQLTTQLALHLRRHHGVRRGQRVALCLAPGSHQVVAILALLKSGAAYVPLDPADPPARLADLIADVAPSLLIADAAAPGCAVQVPCLDYARWLGAAAAGGVAEAGAGSDALAAIKGSDPAYLIFTSGSTGRPKGVVINHANLGHYCVARYAFFAAHGVSHGLAWGWSSAYTFDMSWQGLSALCMGHPLVVVPAHCRSDGQLLNAYIRRHDIGILDLTPTQMAALLAVEQVPPVSVLVLAGEAIESGLWRQIAVLPGVLAMNAYGPTECTINTTLAVISGDTPHLGTPLSGWHGHVVDRAGRLVPPGVAGELYIGGGGVSQGYWQRPQLTAQRFICDHWSGRVGERLYRSGDRVRWRRDGTLEYLGRNDAQLKIRGYRVEAGEVETRLQALPGVAAAAVCALATDTGRSLAAVVVTSVGGELDEVAAADWWRPLHAQLSRQLPAYALPQVWRRVAQLPRSRHGKLDRAQLPALINFQPAAAAAAAEPDSTTLRELWALWEQLLSHPVPDSAADFFAMGGHSLLLMRLLYHIENRFGVRLNVNHLFNAPQLAQQAELIDVALLKQTLGRAGDDTDGEREGLVL